MVSEFFVDVVNAVSCCFAVLAEVLGKRVAWFAAIAFLGRCDVIASASLCPVFASNDAAAHCLETLIGVLVSLQTCLPAPSGVQQKAPLPGQGGWVSLLVQARQVSVAIVDATHCGCALSMDWVAVAMPPPIRAHATNGMNSIPIYQVKK